MLIRYSFCLCILLATAGCIPIAKMAAEPPSRPVTGARLAIVDMTALGGVHVTNEEGLRRDVPLQDSTASYADYFWNRFSTRLGERVLFNSVALAVPSPGSALAETPVAITLSAPLSANYCRGLRGLIPIDEFLLPEKGQPVELENGHADVVLLVKQLKIERVDRSFVVRHTPSASPMSPNPTQHSCSEPDGIGIELEAVVWDNRKGVPLLAGYVIAITPGNGREVDHTAWEKAIDEVISLLVRDARLAPRQNARS